MSLVFNPGISGNYFSAELRWSYEKTYCDCLFQSVPLTARVVSPVVWENVTLESVMTDLAWIQLIQRAKVSETFYYH